MVYFMYPFNSNSVPIEYKYFTTNKPNIVHNIDDYSIFKIDDYSKIGIASSSISYNNTLTFW